MHEYQKCILVIEDDVPLAELIKDFLIQHGFDVTVAINGAQASQFCHQQAFDLVICDLMLPDDHGFRLMQRIKKAQHCPYVFLTALSDDETHIEGLQLGATDFIPKPVKPELLLARVNANLRKRQSSDAATCKVGQYCLNARTKRLYRDAQPITLTNQEFDILWLFANHLNSPISREYLFKQLVGRPYDGSDRAADVKISRLRRTLEHAGCHDLYIHTIRGSGYLLTLESNA